MLESCVQTKTHLLMLSLGFMNYELLRETDTIVPQMFYIIRYWMSFSNSLTLHKEKKKRTLWGPDVLEKRYSWETVFVWGRYQIICEVLFENLVRNTTCSLILIENQHVSKQPNCWNLIILSESQSEGKLYDVYSL